MIILLLIQNESKTRLVVAESLNRKSTLDAREVTSKCSENSVEKWKITLKLI